MRLTTVSSRYNPKYTTETRINPTLSPYNMIWGTFYFNRKPMVPPGCKIIVHEKPGNAGHDHFMDYPSFTLDPLWMDIARTRFISQRIGWSNQQTLLIFFTINQNALCVNNRFHHKDSCQYREVLGKTYKSIANQKNGEGKRTAFQKLVNFFLKRRKWSGMRWIQIWGWKILGQRAHQDIRYGSNQS